MKKKTPAPQAPDSPTPAEAGFRMPAEWEPHAATWLAWPHNVEDWPDKFEPIPWIYAEIVRLISAGEKVCIFVQPGLRGRGPAEVRKVLQRNGVDLTHVELIPQPTDRVWTRDSGPIFVRRGKGKRGELAITDWRFNAWAKYDNWKHDDQLPAVAAKRLKLRSWQPTGMTAEGELKRFVLEGGSIDVNGAGCVLTTEECLLSEIQQRNPGLSREEIERTLCAYLGVQKVLWLDRGIAGDDTHGHIDDTARFVNADTIVTCIEHNRRDDNYKPLQENLKRLARMRDAFGKPFNIVELPMPAPVHFEGQRLPASYANFYICNAAVLVPVFNDPNDFVALDVLSACFEDRPVVPVYCRDLVWGLGTLHCMTQQQPAL